MAESGEQGVAAEQERERGRPAEAEEPILTQGRHKPHYYETLRVGRGIRRSSNRFYHDLALAEARRRPSGFAVSGLAKGGRLRVGGGVHSGVQTIGRRD